MRRLATLVLVLLVLLAVGGTVADRLLVARAEERLLTLAREQVELADDAEGVIDGFPFLTQVLAERLAEVRGTTSVLVADGRELRDARVTARGVSPEEPYRAETVEINVTLPAATLEAGMNGSGYVPGNPVRLETAEDVLQLSVSVAGFELSVLLEPVLRGEEIGLEVREVMTGTTSLPQDVTARLNEGVEQLRVPLPDLPEGLAPTRIAVESDGLHVRLEGADIELGHWAR